MKQSIITMTQTIMKTQDLDKKRYITIALLVFIMVLLSFIAGSLMSNNGRYEVMNERQILDTKKGIIYRYNNVDGKIIKVDMVDGKRIDFKLKQ